MKKNPKYHIDLTVHARGMKLRGITGLKKKLYSPAAVTTIDTSTIGRRK
jgi:hypothetical protein